MWTISLNSFHTYRTWHIFDHNCFVFQSQNKSKLQQVFFMSNLRIKKVFGSILLLFVTVFTFYFVLTHIFYIFFSFLALFLLNLENRKKLRQNWWCFWVWNITYHNIVKWAKNDEHKILVNIFFLKYSLFVSWAVPKKLKDVFLLLIVP